MSQGSKTNEFSSDFSKSRNRLVYATSVGILVTIFPVLEQSTILGISFNGLDQTNLQIVLMILCSLLLVDHLLRFREEWPSISGERANLLKLLENQLNAWEMVLAKLEYVLNDIEKVKEITEHTPPKDYEGKLQQLQGNLDSFASAFEKLDRRKIQLVRSNRFGAFRLYVDAFAGFFGFAAFLAIFLWELCVAQAA